MSKGGKLIVFSAPSGSGKTTIVRHLLKHQSLNLEFSISATSREPRFGEQDGVHYYFLDLSEFKRRIKEDEFLEWEEVYRDNFYGTLKSEVERIWDEGKNVIFDIDWQGTEQIKQKKLNYKLITFFILPPSRKVLFDRLSNRDMKNKLIVE